MNFFTGTQPHGQRFAQAMRRTVERMVFYLCRLHFNPHQLRCQRGGELCSVCLHEVIQPVAGTDALHRFMGADIAPGGLINLPFFDVDNVAQCLHSARYTVIPGQHLLAVFLLCGREFGFTIQPGGFVLLTGLKACCSVRVVMVSSPLINGDMASCSSPALYGGDMTGSATGGVFSCFCQTLRSPGVLVASLSMCGRVTTGKPVRESTGSSDSVTEKAFAFPLRKVTTCCMTA